MSFSDISAYLDEIIKISQIYAHLSENRRAIIPKSQFRFTEHSVKLLPFESPMRSLSTNEPFIMRK